MSENEISTAFTVAGIVVNTTVVLAAGLIARILMSRCSAALRHVVLSAALCAAFLVPFISFALQSAHLRLFEFKQPVSGLLVNAIAALPPAEPSLPVAIRRLAVADLPGARADGIPPAPGTTPQLVDYSASQVTTLKPRSAPSLNCEVVLSALSGIWMFGVVFFALRLMSSALKIRHASRKSEPVNERLEEIAAIAGSLLGLKSPVSLRRSVDEGDVSVPMTWGQTLPTVLLPAQADNWSDSCICAAMMHEMAHIKRGDWAMQLLAQTALVFNWFNPLCWKAVELLRIDSETATDDLVLCNGQSPTQYAQSLVDVVRTIPLTSRNAAVAIAMASPADVNRRVLAILDNRKDRRPAARSTALAMAAALCLLATLIAAIRVDAQSTVPSAPGVPGVPTPESDPAPLPVPAPDVPAAPSIPLPAAPVAPTEPPAPPSTPAAPKAGKGDVARQFYIIREIDPSGLKPGTKRIVRVIAVKAKDGSSTLNCYVDNVSTESLKDSHNTPKRMVFYLKSDEVSAREIKVLTDLAPRLKYLSGDDALSHAQIEQLEKMQNSLSKVRPEIDGSQMGDLPDVTIDVDKTESAALKSAATAIAKADNEACTEGFKSEEPTYKVRQSQSVSDQELERIGKRIALEALEIKNSSTNGATDSVAAQKLAADAMLIAEKALEKASQSNQ